MSFLGNYSEIRWMIAILVSVQFCLVFACFNSYVLDVYSLGYSNGYCIQCTLLSEHPIFFVKFVPKSLVHFYAQKRVRG